MKYTWLSISFGYCSGTARNRNLSYQSLQEFEAHSLPPNTYDVLPQSASKEKLKKNTRLTGRAEYIGVSLPVDISMIFQVSGTKCRIILHKRKVINWFSAKCNSNSPKHAFVHTSLFNKKKIFGTFSWIAIFCATKLRFYIQTNEKLFRSFKFRPFNFR